MIEDNDLHNPHMNQADTSNRRWWISSIVLFLLFAISESNGGDEKDRYFPIPITETVPLIKEWGVGQGIPVQALSRDMGRYAVAPEDPNLKWSILLTPQSALSTRISVLSEMKESGDDAKRWESLWVYLDRFAGGKPPADGRSAMVIPADVLAEIESAVCVEATVDGRDIQFSGFIVDKSGLVLCTAHDLKDIRSVAVLLYDGRKVRGTIVRKDAMRDLVLLDTHTPFDAAIPLREARDLVGMGERLYSVGCPARLSGTVHAGYVNGPPRRTRGLPLWQVTMEILPGSSGSPVFDAKGRLVGMVKGRLRGTESIGFLIPVETIMAFLKEG